MKNIFLMLLWLVPTAFARFPEEKTDRISRIAFGSCNRQDADQSYWSGIAAQKPDLWVWLGDCVYNDTEDMAVMTNKYGIMRDAAGYREFRHNHSITGTWDDHDYGKNDGDRSYGPKALSQQHFLDFIDEPVDSARRQTEGVYGVQGFGPPGNRVRLILLDDRYYAEGPGPESDLLGSNQWAFLEQSLATNAAEFVIIASGIQMLAQDHRFERWSKYPRSHKRLLDTITASGVSGVVLISGDRHLHEIAMQNDDLTPYPLFEVTSSGLTHAGSNNLNEKNRFRIGPMLTQRGFGMIEINWDAQPRTVSLQLRHITGECFHEISIPASLLESHKHLH